MTKTKPMTPEQQAALERLRRIANGESPATVYEAILAEIAEREGRWDMADLTFLMGEDQIEVNRLALAEHLPDDGECPDEEWLSTVLSQDGDGFSLFGDKVNSRGFRNSLIYVYRNLDNEWRATLCGTTFVNSIPIVSRGQLRTAIKLLSALVPSTANVLPPNSAPSLTG